MFPWLSTFFFSKVAALPVLNKDFSKVPKLLWQYLHHVLGTVILKELFSKIPHLNSEKTALLQYIYAFF